MATINLTIPDAKLPRKPCRASPMATIDAATRLSSDDTSKPSVPAAARMTTNFMTSVTIEPRNPDISGSIADLDIPACTS